MGNMFSFFEKHPSIKIEKNFSFANHTTYGIGGKADLCARPSSLEEALAIITFLERENVPYVFLGVGANVLANDEDFHGVVIKFDRLNSIERRGEKLFVGAGVTGGRLISFARENLLSGVEFLTGIPTSVGGACTMNAGVKEGHFSDVVSSVVTVKHSSLLVLTNDECRFGTKKSIFQQKLPVLGVELTLKSASRAQIEERLTFFRNKRKHLPKGRSAGCVFVNPKGVSAGALIEGAGLKGKTVGGALISTEHANFIISNNATTQDVKKLIEIVTEAVYERYGLLLEREVKFIP